MRILMVGAGATGGYFGGRLVQAGRDATFLVRGKRAQQLHRDGLKLRTPAGDATIAVHTTTAADLTPYDLVLVSTKAYSLVSAMADFAPAVGDNTLVLPLLNGMGHMDLLRERFGAAHILGGCCRIIGELHDDGTVEQKTPLADLTFGALDAATEPHMAALQAELNVPGFDVVLTPDAMAAMWQKWFVLASMNAACILARGTLGQAAQQTYGADQNRAILAEAAAIAHANGYAPRPKALDAQTKVFTDPASPITSSMYRDMLRGAQVEADQILGDYLERAHGTPAPLLTAAYVQLKVYQASRPK